MSTTTATKSTAAPANSNSGPAGRKTGAWLSRYALEQLPVSFTFGIPGVHNTEIYDELNKSEKIHPVLVTHEGGASFMADGVSRTSAGIGTLLIVPAAGVTHAMSGIGEAFLDGIPLLVISGGIRRDTDKSFQLHDWDQQRFLSAITKKTFLVRSHEEVVPTIFEAYQIATSGEPGPVFVEIPVDVQLFKGAVTALPVFEPAPAPPRPDDALLDAAISLLADAKAPGMFLGWGARDATQSAVALAELLAAPVATTLQGLSVFPGEHPLFVGMGFGPAAVPAAENAFRKCDCLLAVGTRFGEIPCGSYGVTVPERLIHIDINPEVFDKNYPAEVKIASDAAHVMPALLERMQTTGFARRDAAALSTRIAADKEAYAAEWRKHVNDRVSPALFFLTLRHGLADDAIVVADDGNHTFLAAELFTVRQSRGFISPTDFNCMGYCVPAAIGAKLANPKKQVVGIVGDGAFLMTCMELLTASVQNAGVVIFVFHDGELSQISQGQEIPYNRKVCTVLGDLRLQGVAQATGAAFYEIRSNQEIGEMIEQALTASAKGQPVIVDVNIDYSKRTRFTTGVVDTVLKRFPLGDKFRFIGRALTRKITG